MAGPGSIRCTPAAGTLAQGPRPPDSECTGSARRGSNPRSTAGAPGRVGAGRRCGARMRAMTTPRPPDSRPAVPSRVSARVGSITESATLAVDAKAKALKASRPPGDRVRRRRARLPDPGVHRRGGRRGRLRDPAITGTPHGGAARAAEAIAAKTARDSGYRVDAAQVLVTNGGKQAVYEAFATLLDPGDEVLLPTPYWTTYPESIRLAGGVPVEVLTDETSGYLVTVEQLAGRADPADEGAAVLLPVQPDRCGLRPGAGRADRPLGARARRLGRHRRDLRAPRLRRRGVLVDAGGRFPSWPTRASSSTASPRPTP